MVEKVNTVPLVENNSLEKKRYLHSELLWLSTVISIRINNQGDIPEANLIKESNKKCNYAKLVHEYKMDIYDRLLMILAIAPYLLPSIFKDLFPENYTPKPLQFREGGVISKSGRSFLPTLETYLYLACGNDVNMRVKLLQRINQDYFLFKERIIELGDEGRENTTLLNKTIKLSEEFYFSLVLEKSYQPSFSSSFPAQKLTSKMTWEDLVLNTSTLTEVKEIKNWIALKKKIEKSDNRLSKRMAKGYKALFYGPPGTGKTLTATLLGNELNLDVYRIDLSMVVSKYIGETEKNLAKVFDMAERKNWILFFDEADALFGQRTQVNNSNDRYANQEVSFLLQRVETFNGVVILSSNLKNNIDHAFIRRFNSIIYFPKPKEAERLKMWKITLPEDVILDKDVNLDYVAKKYHLTGAHIENVVLRALSKMNSENQSTLNLATIHSCVAQELMKESITV